MERPKNQHPVREFVRLCVNLCSAAVVFFSVGGILAGPLTSEICPSVNPHFARRFEFPLSHPTDVVADAQGRIYIALSFYDRVQVYSPSGAFLHGFFVPARGGTFCLRFDDNGMLNAITARGRQIHVYNRDGTLLRTGNYRNAAFFARAELDHQFGFVDGDRRRYLIRNPLWNPRILRIEPTGRASLEIKTPAILTVFIGPLPCWTTIASAGLLWHITKKRRADPANEPNASS